MTPTGKRVLAGATAAVALLGGAAWAHPHPAKVSRARAATVQAKSYNLVLDIVTGGMIHKPGWPSFRVGGVHGPAASVIDLPANADVHVTIVSYDDGAAPVSAPFDKVKGTWHNVMRLGNQLVTGIAPAKVAHTFTVEQLGLNVPIPVAPGKGHPVQVAFTFHTGKPGKYSWQCMAPCGSGKTGWGGPMVTVGYMRGWVVVR